MEGVEVEGADGVAGVEGVVRVALLQGVEGVEGVEGVVRVAGVEGVDVAAAAARFNEEEEVESPLLELDLGAVGGLALLVVGEEVREGDVGVVREVEEVEAAGGATTVDGGGIDVRGDALGGVIVLLE